LPVSIVHFNAILKERKMKRINLIYLLASLLSGAGLTGCNKLIEIGAPLNQLVTSSVFSDTATAESAVLGMYSMVANGLGGVDMGTATSMFNGMSSDEGYYFQTYYDEFFQNALTPSFYYIDSYWSGIYTDIYNANSLIAGDSASSLPASYRARVIGEAKFVRALCYFYLVNEYGAVPLVLTTDVQASTNQPRDSVGTVYNQILKDLTDARGALPADLSLYGGNAIRATTWAAEALLARVYVYRGDWSQSEAMATAVIGNPGLFSMQSDLTQVFLAGSTEGILQFPPPFAFSWMANTLGSASYSPTPNFVLSDSLYAAFETGDLRLADWVGVKNYGGTNYPYPNKYTYVSGIGPVQDAQFLRMSEQYLIRAEAETRQGNFGPAAADVNVVRTRAGLAGTTANNMPSLMAAIEHENRIEFFCEWGHRWLDLNRLPGIANPSLTRADEVYPVDKTTPWQPYDALFPIPLPEITTNANLTQNPGYN
jgi:starch-binding outer membrane protein, SusD/RagB family